MLPVTKPYLPEKARYDRYVQQIWDRNWLTNSGPLVNKLELDLKACLGLDHLLYLSNGTIALQIACKALELAGEVITTPFSYVATTSSLVWEGLTPVFADIDPLTLNINPAAIEQQITDKTSAILATHVYGNPCDVAAIQQIADKHGLKVIYDAAHAFGTLYNGKSLFAYGDISTASFHATKIFHTIEGGAVISPSAELTYRMSYLRNFGHEGYEHFAGIGINGKNSEFHAAMGLSILPDMPAVLAKRKMQSGYYDDKLQTLRVARPVITSGTSYNHAYYPVIFESEAQLLKSFQTLADHNIFARRYFYPALHRLPYVKSTDCPIAGSISTRVMCLPLFHDLTEAEQDMICRLLLRVQNN